MKLIRSTLIVFLLGGVFAFANAQEFSEEAENHMFRGEAAMEDARDAAGYQKAVVEFKKATELAPDWPNAWYNLGVAQELSGDLGGAISSFNRYMELSPGAEDYDDVRKNVAKMEYRLEQANAERRAAETQRRADEALARKLEGIWINPPIPPSTHTNVSTGKKYKCGKTYLGHKIKISSVGNVIKGTIIGTAVTHPKDPCKTWYEKKNIFWIDAKIIRGRMVGIKFTGYIKQNGKWVEGDEELDFPVVVSLDGRTFTLVHDGENSDRFDEWIKE